MGKTTAKGAEALLANIAALKANKLPLPGLVLLPMLKLRMQTTDFLDAQERALAQQAMDALALTSGDDEH